MKKRRSSRIGSGPMFSGESSAEPNSAPSPQSENTQAGITMKLRWLVCGTGNMHIVGPCPNCFVTQSGLLLGTVASTYKGRVTAKCVDCGKTEDYYVDAREGKIWRLEEVMAKGVHVQV